MLPKNKYSCEHYSKNYTQGGKISPNESNNMQFLKFFRMNQKYSKKSIFAENIYRNPIMAKHNQNV